MIPKIISAETTSKIYSILGNNSSLVPLGIKDTANGLGFTTASYLSGEDIEGEDRFIDEFGTQAIWLGGLPLFKKISDWTLIKPSGFDPKIDVRILKNPQIIEAAKELAPTEAIRNSLKHAAEHQKTFKALTLAKFAAATVLTTASYFGLTKFRHKYTENQIKKQYYEKHPEKQDTFTGQSVNNQKNQNNNKNIAFTGGFQDFIFDPVKNLMLVDVSITGERLAHARNPQDFFGYVLKEGSFWAFMYFAGPLIAKALEKNAEKKHNKSIDLDARVIECKQLKDSFKDGSLKSHLAAFKNADKSDADLYKYAVNSVNSSNLKDMNLVIEMAKKSDIIETLNGANSKVDTRKYIDLGNLRGVSQKLEKLLTQYENSGENIDTFFKTVRKLKRSSVLKNMGACIGVLGILTPALMLLERKSENKGSQLKNDIESKLAAGQM